MSDASLAAARPETLAKARRAWVRSGDVQGRESIRELWLERVLLPLDVRHLRGPRRISYGDDELLVVCLARNAAPHIRTFLEHYVRLGARHVVLLDNGSDDDTVELAALFPQVSVFRTTLPFRNNNCGMRRYLIRRFGRRRHWVLCVDVDELFDYPLSDRVRPGALLGYLRAKGYTAMAAYLLDMFPEGPIARAPGPGADLRAAHPFYDVSGVRKVGYFDEDGYGAHRFVRHNTVAPGVKRYLGGVRAAAFDLPDLYLIKHPLTFQDGRVRLSHQHFADHASVADVTGVLYHYKFVEDFGSRVGEAVRTGAYADGSFEYRQYQRALERHPDLSLKSETARALGSVNDLVALDFLQASDDYRAWAERATPS
jgi:Glycosyl transferase family 2